MSNDLYKLQLSQTPPALRVVSDFCDRSPGVAGPCSSVVGVPGVASVGILAV